LQQYKDGDCRTIKSRCGIRKGVRCVAGGKLYVARYNKRKIKIRRKVK